MATKKKKLIIVESPTKVRSLSRFLGKKDFEIASSKGHIMDLPKSKMGIDFSKNFSPHYITIQGKGKVLEELRKKARLSSEILLATDPDREGEAISYHLKTILEKVNPAIKRIEFHEITPQAVQEALKNPRDIDIKRVYSQQARRVLDRIVGYILSPLLQNKLGSKHFSAGRVQSAALKILCDREEEIENFQPEEYWEIQAAFLDEELLFDLVKIEGKKPHIPNQEEAEKIQKEILSTSFYLKEHKKTQRKRKPPPPYITSTLQQDASNKLGFSVQKTMQIAQRLYEGVDIGEETIGLITYMRTDSTRLSSVAIEMAREFIKKHFPKEYLPPSPREYHAKKTAQDAHEAIRPTDIERTPEKMEPYLSPDEGKLYKLIWKRFLASQMADSIEETQSIELEDPSKKYLFRISSTKVIFPGFRKILEEKRKKEKPLPSCQESTPYTPLKVELNQKFTQPPPRYSEASLVKKMEELGIGRPATYAPTIEILLNRGYVEKKGRQLIPTSLGKIVNQVLKEHFPNIVHAGFTADMEEKLDKIARGEEIWYKMVGNFYYPFIEQVQEAEKNIRDLRHLVEEKIGKKCPQCGGDLVKKLGKNGFFVGCKNFPQCRYTESLSYGKCPLCGGDVVRKRSKKGRAFYGCSNFQKGCTFIMNLTPSKRTCPKCNSLMGEKIRKDKIELICQNPKCGFQMEESVERSETS